LQAFTLGTVAGRMLSAAIWLVLLAGASLACTGGSERQAGRQANALLEEGRTDEALAAYREGRRQWPTTGIFPYGEGLSLYLLDRSEEAEAPLREAIRLSPGAADNHLYLGHVLSKLDRQDESVGAYEEATRLAPMDGRGWKALGYTHYNAGRYREARVALEKYLAFARDAPDYEAVWHLIQTLPPAE
jgi:MSHA biogenesis protein MshN